MCIHFCHLRSTDDIAYTLCTLLILFNDYAYCCLNIYIMLTNTYIHTQKSLAGFKKPPISSFSANVNVTTFELNANPATLAEDAMQFECDPSLMGLEDRGRCIMLLRQILLDSGRDQCILNRFFRH